MSEPTAGSSALSAEVCHRAVEAQDPRFDGLFYVGITTTGIYCRPICPSRRAEAAHRRFFPSRASAERQGYRPCLRCRPELAPGRALVDAVPRLAAAAARRIAEGALNGTSVGSLADDLHVSERHLRRCLKREVGASPVELAQTHRLLLAKRLLADTDLDMSRVAFASGFQSLRRFNALVRERYGMTPTDIRRAATEAGNGGRDGSPGGRGAPPEAPDGPTPDPLRLTLAYHPPFAWSDLLAFLGPRAIAGVEVVRDGSYARTVRLGDRSGVVRVEDGAPEPHVAVENTPELLPELMTLLARVRRLFDLDAEPGAVDEHLEAGGLAPLVRRRPGLRLPGAFDGFEVAMSTVLRAPSVDPGRDGGDGLAARVAAALGDPIDTGIPRLERLRPGPERVADAGAAGLRELGVPESRARTLVTVARAVADGRLQLDPGGDPEAVRRSLERLAISDRLAATIAMRSLRWPDVFPTSDPALQRAAGAAGPAALRARAERWRPWRAYAAMHLWLDGGDV